MPTRKVVLPNVTPVHWLYPVFVNSLTFATELLQCRSTVLFMHICMVLLSFYSLSDKSKAKEMLGVFFYLKAIWVIKPDFK